MKTKTEGAAMNPSTPKTEPPPSTQLRKAIFGGSHENKIESFGKPPTKFTDAVNLPESPAPSPEEVRREVAIIKN